MSQKVKEIKDHYARTKYSKRGPIIRFEYQKENRNAHQIKTVRIYDNLKINDTVEY